MRLFVSEGRPSELAILAANHTTTTSWTYVTHILKLIVFQPHAGGNTNKVSIEGGEIPGTCGTRRTEKLTCNL